MKVEVTLDCNDLDRLATFWGGFVEYDLEQDRVRRVAKLPIADHVEDMPREQYLLDSAHHGSR